MSLFPQRLHRVHQVTEYDFVPVQNGHRARYVIDEHGKKWVRKLEEDTGFQGLLAEAIVTLLGRHIGAPVPDGGIQVGVVGSQAWLSALVEDAIHWSPARRYHLLNPTEAGAMLALDAILLNDDRHSGNILLVPDPDEAHLRLHAIDGGNALVGWVGDYLAWPADEIPRIENQARGLPLDALREGAATAARVASEIDRVLLREFVGEGCGFAREPDVDPLTDAIEARCRGAVDLSSRYLDALGALK